MPRRTSQQLAPEESELIPPGTILAERYKVTRRLGHGGMGVVYLGEHIHVGRTVAIKVLWRHWCSNLAVVLRFRAEARAASAAGHPNIVEVLDAGELPDGRPILVMEYVEGPTLATLVEDVGPLDPTRASTLMSEVARGIRAAHAVGVIHRDLKPENVVLVTRAEGESVKILDFGIAAVDAGLEATRTTTPGLAVGTPEFMAPEQTRGVDPTARFDIYSMGAMMFELVTGAPPITGDHPMDVIAAKVREPAPSLATRCPALPIAIVELVDDCLAIDPARRPQSATAFLNRLDAATTRSSTPDTKRNFSTWTVVGAIAATACVGGLVAITWARSSSETVDPPAELTRHEQPLHDASSSPRMVDQPAHDPTTPPLGGLAPDPIPTNESGKASDAQPETPPSPTRRHRKHTKSQAHESNRCARTRRGAYDAREGHDWGRLLQRARTKECWPTRSERRKLEVLALLELKRFAECVRIGRELSDPEVRKWVAICKGRSARP